MTQKVYPTTQGGNVRGTKTLEFLTLAKSVIFKIHSAPCATPTSFASPNACILTSISKTQEK